MTNETEKTVPAPSDVGKPDMAPLQNLWGVAGNVPAEPGTYYIYVSSSDGGDMYHDAILSRCGSWCSGAVCGGLEINVAGSFFDCQELPTIARKYGWCFRRRFVPLPPDCALLSMTEDGTHGPLAQPDTGCATVVVSSRHE